MSNHHNDWKGADWKRWQAGLVDEGSIKRCLPDRFARCHCGTIEHLMMGETGDRFFCCDCRAMRVAIIITARKRKAA